MNVAIRKYNNSDIENFYLAVRESINEVSEWLPWCNLSYSIEDTKKWILEKVPMIWKTKTGCEFIIVDDKNNVLGGCCLEQLDLINKEASIGYWIRSSKTKMGIATKASNLLLEYGFEQLNLNRIKVIPSVQNVASVKVADKLPFDEIKLVKNGFKIKDKTFDAKVFIISKQSYLTSKNFKAP
jgi:RimJ/RimL family protein N-acetyltransferase